MIRIDKEHRYLRIGWLEIQWTIGTGKLLIALAVMMVLDAIALWQIAR